MTEVWITGVKITVSWSTGAQRRSRAFRIETTGQIRDLKAHVEYELRGSSKKAVPIELDDNAMAAVFDQMFGGTGQ